MGAPVSNQNPFIGLYGRTSGVRPFFSPERTAKPPSRRDAKNFQPAELKGFYFTPPDSIKPLNQIMFVRFRVNSWLFFSKAMTIH